MAIMMQLKEDKMHLRKKGIDVWVYFSPSFFYWVCYNSLEPDSCPISLFVQSAVGWEDLNTSDPILNKGDIGNVQCSSSHSPTRSPSRLPTSPVKCNVY